MKYIADLHIHSKFSRATSKQMDLEHLDQWAKIKGIDILGTGDFTHPEWFRELKNKLESLGNGLYKLRNYEKITKLQIKGVQASACKVKGVQASACKDTIKGVQASACKDTNFILTAEISCIYTQGGKGRRIHIVILAPDLETVEKINIRLAQTGNIKSDGRPILGLSAKELTKIVLDVSTDCLIVPGHIWTPWFSLFGSRSGFDSIEECFEELTPEIYALETGLSSDAIMNWRLSVLDKYTLISNSDAHSLVNLGREANVFEGNNLSYLSIINAIKKQKLKQIDNNLSGSTRIATWKNTDLKLVYTIEFFPEEGKYHFDGHRDCGIRFSPEQTKKAKGICPKCKKSLTAGVMNRVDVLADRDHGIKPKRAAGYKSLVPLQEIIAEALEKNKTTKAVQTEYQNLTRKGKSEFNILLNLSYKDLSEITSPKIVEGIRRVREGKLEVLPGYDGVYGTVKVFSEEEKKRQARLFFGDSTSV